MIPFTYKLKLNGRVRAKCSRHPATTQRNTTLADGFRDHYVRIGRYSPTKPELGLLAGLRQSSLCIGDFASIDPAINMVQRAC